MSRRYLLLFSLLVACGDDASGTPDGAASIDAAGALDAADAATTLGVTNLDPDEELGYNLALLRGQALGDRVAITNGGETIEWPVVGGTYKALVPLAAGANTIALASGGETTTFPLQFTEQTNPYYVRPIWIEGADGDGSFQAPAGMVNTEAEGMARLKLAAWMWQTFYAEVMHARGHGRVTFKLLLDADGTPTVTAARSTKTVAALRALSDTDVWSQLYGDFGSFGGPARERIKDVGMLSFSLYDPSQNRILAGGALGGGHQATMHGASVYSWPARLADVPAAFLDETRIDATQLADDSVGRGTYWASYTTTSGAVLHELGHTLGLPHDADYRSIMFRGFDEWNRYFMSSEAPSRTGTGIAAITDDDLPVALVDYEAQWLRFDRWLAQTPPPPSTGAIRVMQSGDTITVTSMAGIRDVMFWNGDQTFAADTFVDPAPTTQTYSAAALRTRFPDQTRIGLLVRDTTGTDGQLELAAGLALRSDRRPLSCESSWRLRGLNP